MRKNNTIILSLILIFNAAISLNAQDVFMTSIAPLTELAGSIPEDFKIKPTSGTASSYQSGEGIEKAFDGNYTTIYHSNWNTTTFPVTLQFNLPEEDLDYLVYYPRTTGGDNGKFKEVEIWYTGQNDERLMIGDFNFLGSSSATKIEFDETLIKVKSVEFIVKSGVSDYASCAEMEFYKRNPERQSVTELFEDELLTTLKPGVTLAQIDQMENPFFREFARELYRGDYSLEFRVGEHFPYMDRTTMYDTYMVNAYDLYENPTGIYFPIGKNVIIVSDLEKGRSVSLVIPNYLHGDTKDWSLPSRSYPLQNGINVIDVTGWGGLGYISYFTPEWETASSISIHVPRGTVQGYFDVQKHTNEDFVRILADANAYTFMDVLGARTHLAFRVEDFRAYTKGNAVELVRKWDEMVTYEQKYMGWEKYQGYPKNRVHVRGNQSYYMYKDGTGASFEHSTMNLVANPDRFYLDNWGPCHEVGHIHQFKFNNWSGMGEVSVNFPNRYFRYFVVDPTYSDSSNDFDKAYTKVVKAGIPLLTTPDVFDRLVPFSQLFYYFMEKEYEDFFPDLNNALIKTPDDTNGWGPAQYEMNFAKTVCETTQLNLLPFFEKWGMLYYTDQDGREPFNVGDYTSGQYKLEKSKVDELKAYIQGLGYPEPDEDISLVKPGKRRITP